ncbi:DNA polymerase II small subunit [mine drainage metagenome]|uniref:DNA polymerase II small subunit n=1 Tax=mine drainage metagenome TaxID=410659 RepID=T1ALF1_9ZZZZ
MRDKELLKALSKLLSQSGILLSADIDTEALKGVNIDALSAKIIELNQGASTVTIVDADMLRSALSKLEAESASKVPAPVEVKRSSDFKPIAAAVEAEYQIKNRPSDRAEGSVSDFVAYFRSRLSRIKEILSSHRSYVITQSIDNIKNFMSGREVVVAGILTNRITTKNGNIMVVMEDETGEAKIMFMNNTSADGKKLFNSASRLINDEVVAVKGKISGPFIIAKEIVWPDVPIRERKAMEDDIAIAFMSDIHIGSKLFMKKNFTKMLSWLNGGVDTKSRELAGKIKYIIMGGDVVDGIGVYPDHDRDLAVLDIYSQYQMLAEYIEAIPDYIHVFVLPGNHDAVQRAEPQPPFPEELLDIKLSNVHMVSNPSTLMLHKLNVLTYHGTSLDSIISSIPGLSYSKPEEAMLELLKRRHLSPVYGGNIIVPTQTDNLVIDEVPDIMHMGHIHKNGLLEYHGVQVVNSGTWQDRTDFQVRQGHIPTPCNLPVFEAKRYSFTTIDFTGVV